MTDEIIELLPSDDLKAVIKEKKHQFSDDELLQIIYSYAPTFDARLELLERFSAVASPNVSALAKAYIKYEQDNFKRFTEESEGFVYELFEGVGEVFINISKLKTHKIFVVEGLTPCYFCNGLKVLLCVIFIDLKKTVAKFIKKRNMNRNTELCPDGEGCL